MKKLFLAFVLSALSGSTIFGMVEQKENFFQELPFDLMVEIVKQSGAKYSTQFKNMCSLARTNKAHLELVTNAFSSPLIIKKDAQKRLQRLLDLANFRCTGIIQNALINAGADLRKVSVAKIKQGNLLNHLLDLGADPNSKDENRLTGLLRAVICNHKAKAKLLVDHRADVNMQSKNGITPLMFAAQNGYKDMAQWLVAQGADVHMQSDKGITARMFATQNGHTEIVKLLKKAGKPKRQCTIF